MTIEILTNIILPVFFLIGVGVLIDRTLPVDLATLNKLGFYVFIPAIVFIKLLDSSLAPDIFGVVVAFAVLHMALLLGISWKAFSLPAFRKDRAVLTMGAIFFNSANYGFPFALLAFGDLGTSVMAIILMTQLIGNFSVGLWLVGVGKGSRKELVMSFLRAPVVYVMLAAVVMNTLHLRLPEPLYQPINYLADGLIPTALISLGVQLSRSKAGGRMKPVAIASAARLLVSPLLALALAAGWSLLAPGQMRELAPILIAAAGLPVAVNVYILAVEYGEDAELASESIFWSTLLSALTLTFWLMIV